MIVATYQARVGRVGCSRIVSTLLSLVNTSKYVFASTIAMRPTHLGLMVSKAPLELSGGSPCPPKIVPPSLTGTYEERLTKNVSCTAGCLNDESIYSVMLLRFLLEVPLHPPPPAPRLPPSRDYDDEALAICCIPDCSTVSQPSSKIDLYKPRLHLVEEAVRVNLLTCPLFYNGTPKRTEHLQLYVNFLALCVSSSGGLFTDSTAISLSRPSQCHCRV